MDVQRVYHFTSAEVAFLIMRGKRLKVSRLKELNDPFELMALRVSDRRVRAYINSVVDQVHEAHGFICFSGNWKNPVQWAHYADRHRGICLGFDVDRSIIRPITYTGERVSEQHFVDLIKGGDDEGLVSLSFTKFAHWSYEEEVRVICDLEDMQHDGNFYIDLEHRVKLREVIVGARNTITTRRQIIAALAGAKGVKVFQARPAFQTFEMVEQKDRRLGV